MYNFFKYKNCFSNKQLKSSKCSRISVSLRSAWTIEWLLGQLHRKTLSRGEKKRAVSTLNCLNFSNYSQYINITRKHIFLTVLCHNPNLLKMWVVTCLPQQAGGRNPVFIGKVHCGVADNVGSAPHKCWLYHHHTRI